MDKKRPITLVVNGQTVAREVAPRMTLAEFLRGELQLTGTHVGCEMGVCGACTVRLDGEIVRSCLMFAVQADGCRVETVEGLTETGVLAPLQESFHQRNALQCGYCTPGVLVTMADLLEGNPHPTRGQIRDRLSGNYCRCTGYHSIVDAVEAVTCKSAAGE